MYEYPEPVNIIADEYTVCIENATYPVLLFSLDTVSKDRPCPTFIALERNLAYDWSALPSYMHATPTVDPDSLNRMAFHEAAVPGTIAFLKQLKEISPESKINFACVDNYPELILKCLYANGWTEENTHITMYSDGYGTYSLEQNALSGTESESETKYNVLKEEWNTAKKNALLGNTDYLEPLINKYGRAHQILQSHAAVIAAEEKNISWVVGRKDLLKSNSQIIQNAIQSAATQASIADQLKALNVKQSEALKNLYKFNTEMFSEAELGNKEIMMFIGTRNDTGITYYLSDYLTFIKNFYGTKYEFYYKGHPGDPSLPGSERALLLDSLGWHELDASIAAELILFYCPDVYLCGYNSTTFTASDDEHTLTIMATGTGTAESLTKTAVSNGYAGNVSSYMYKTADNIYRVNFTDPSLPYSYMIWDPENETVFSYYAEDGTKISAVE